MSIFTSIPQMQKLFVALIISSTGLIISNTVFANESPADNHENIEVTQQNVTPEELAAIYVLHEICPGLLKKQTGFEQGYVNLLKDYLPNEKKPVDFLSNLSRQPHFKDALKQARDDAKQAGDQANLEICQDVINYQPYK